MIKLFHKHKHSILVIHQVIDSSFFFLAFGLQTNLICELLLPLV
jgi:hypothetical protein